MSEAIRILVIDDSLDDRSLYRRALQNAADKNYSISEAEDGENGLKNMQSDQPACVLLDYSLPGYNGIEVLRRIRAAFPFIPVVMLTGQGNETVAVNAMREGAQNYISKSNITRETLGHTIRMAIEHCLLQKHIDEQRIAMEKTREQLRQSQKMEALGQLTGGIAHDFNNLLNIILGNLDVLQERMPASDPLREFVDTSINAVSIGSDLTKRLLTFSRKQPLKPSIIALNNMLANFVKLVRSTLGVRIEIALSTSSDLYPINVDAGQLENALLNLSVNARDAMPDGGSLVYETGNVILDKNDTAGNVDVMPGEYVMLAVRDSGTGMSQETIEKAFEPFFTTKEIGKGTGLGLSMVYGFVRQSQGHIKILSELGHGTEFRLYFPKAEGVTLDAGVVEKPSDKPASAQGKTILVVEDNKEVLKITASMVESLGHTVIRASTAEEAMDVLKSDNTIDMLLTDVMLGSNMDGQVLAQNAIAMRPDIKVLFNSGFAGQATSQGSLIKDSVNLIRKPFHKSQLAQKLAELLK